MIELALLLHIASGLAPGYAEHADIRGARPAREVRSALASARTTLATCAASPNADLFIDVEILAAGFVDRADLFASAGTLDERCVVDALRAMAFTDRGLEPPTHAIVHLAVREDDVEPRPTPRDIALALATHADDLERCVTIARRDEPTLGGTLILSFTVAPDGGASVLLAGGSLNSDAARDCIARELREVRFARVAHAAPAPGVASASVVAWPLFFAKPRPKPAARVRDGWQAPTLVDFLGCGGALPTP